MDSLNELYRDIGEFSATLKEVKEDVTEIKADVKHLLLFKAKVTAYGTIGGMFGGAAAWMIASRLDNWVTKSGEVMVAWLLL